MGPWQKLEQTLTQLGHGLGDLFGALGQLLVLFNQQFPLWPLLIVWVAWWLWGVNWRRAWPVLGKGGWVPLVLLMLLAALVWSRLAPSEVDLGAPRPLPNFWWQLGAVTVLVLSALFCGWLQGLFNWAPPEINLEPPATPAVDHGHGHGHH